MTDKKLEYYINKWIQLHPDHTLPIPEYWSSTGEFIYKDHPITLISATVSHDLITFNYSSNTKQCIIYRNLLILLSSSILRLLHTDKEKTIKLTQITK